MHSENGIYLFEDTLSVHYYVKVKGIKELSDGFQKFDKIKLKLKFYVN